MPYCLDYIYKMFIIANAERYCTIIVIPFKSIYPVAITSLIFPSYSDVFLLSSIWVILLNTGLIIIRSKHLFMNRYGWGNTSKYFEGFAISSQLSSGCIACYFFSGDFKQNLIFMEHLLLFFETIFFNSFFKYQFYYSKFSINLRIFHN